MSTGTILEQYVLSLGWTLLHFLWQGAAIWLLCETALRLSVTPRSRYTIALTAFLALAAAPVVTFLVLLPEFGGAVTQLGATSVIASSVAAEPSLLLRIELLVEDLLPWAVMVWLIGVVLHGARFVRALTGLGHLVHPDSTRPLPTDVAARVDELIQRLGIRRAVLVLQSKAVAVPTVLGWLRPVVLVPPAVLSGLSTQQLDLIVAHELAHIRRHDYLVNLLQVVVETLLFYHPAVRAISQRMREEREDCCDDMVVHDLGQPITYARALTELEGLRAPESDLCMAASGGHLVRRIHRLVGRPYHKGSAIWSQILAVAMVASTLVLAGGLILPAPTHEPEPTVSLPPVASAPASIETAEPVDAQTESATSMDAGSASATTEEVDVEEASTGVSDAVQTGDSAGPDAPPTDPVPTVPEEAETEGSGGPAMEDAADRTDTDAPTEVPLEPAVTGLRLRPGTDASAGPVVEAVAESSTPPARRSAPVPDGPVFGGGEQLITVEPRFPNEAIAAGADGVVTVRFTVTETGAVEDVMVLGETHPALADSVRMAVDGWRYRPFTFQGEPIERRFERSFEFNITTRKQDYRNGNCTPVTGSRVCPVRQFEAREYGVKVLAAGSNIRR